MLNKNKSKQVFKLKYLVLIPVLLSMLIYTSCEKGEPEQLSKNEKRLISLYVGAENDRKEIKSKKEGYFDLYMGDAPDGKKISYDKLTNEEKVEYDGIVDSFNKNDKNFQKFEIFEMKDGKRALFQVVDFKGMKNNRESTDYSNADVIPFSVVEKVPIFPGCEDAEDPKKCTQLKIKEHVLEDFDATLGKQLDLDSGKKKVYVQFTIDKEGNITKVKARGPHEKLEEEAHRVIKKLPQMIPGELGDGKKVGVQYTLPISLVIE